jgi:hypothetical protein
MFMLYKYKGPREKICCQWSGKASEKFNVKPVTVSFGGFQRGMTLQIVSKGRQNKHFK